MFSYGSKGEAKIFQANGRAPGQHIPEGAYQVAIWSLYSNAASSPVEV